MRLPTLQLGAKLRAMRSQTPLRWLKIALFAGIGVLLVLQFLPTPLKAWVRTQEVRDGLALVSWVAAVGSQAVDPQRRMRPASWAFFAAFILTIAALPLVPLAHSYGMVSKDDYAGLSLGLIFANGIFGVCVLGFQGNAKVIQAGPAAN